MKQWIFKFEKKKKRNETTKENDIKLWNCMLVYRDWSLVGVGVVISLFAWLDHSDYKLKESDIIVTRKKIHVEIWIKHVTLNKFV